jgi:hypothetical protein
MKIKNIFAVSVATAVLSSCAMTVPFKVTNNEVGTKIGKSSSIVIGTAQAGIFLNKNFGIIEAAKKGKISKIGVVDVRTDNYIIFTKQTFIVSGE